MCVEVAEREMQWRMGLFLHLREAKVLRLEQATSQFGAGGGIRTHGGLRQRMSQETSVVRLSPPPFPRGVDPLFRPGSGTPASFYSIHVF